METKPTVIKDNCLALYEFVSDLIAYTATKTSKSNCDTCQMLLTSLKHIQHSLTVDIKKPTTCYSVSTRPYDFLVRSNFPTVEEAQECMDILAERFPHESYYIHASELIP